MLLVLLLSPAQGDLLGHHTLSLGDQIAVLTIALAIGTVPLVALLQVLQAVVSAASAQWLALFFGRLHVGGGRALACEIVSLKLPIEIE